MGGLLERYCDSLWELALLTNRAVGAGGVPEDDAASAGGRVTFTQTHWNEIQLGETCRDHLAVSQHAWVGDLGFCLCVCVCVCIMSVSPARGSP